MINSFLHYKRSHLFLDAQLQIQPIQPGKHDVSDLLIACVCSHIKNGWGLDIFGLLWFVRTTTDVVQNMTPNWLTTRDIWWSVSAELACQTDMNKTCLLWQHVADILPTLPTKPIQSQLKCRESGVLRTTGNIGTKPSLSILHGFWAKPIIFVGTSFWVSYTIFHMEDEGKNIWG